ncbi:FtsX-like permease family protein [Embleya sp. AB8]|uniref:FtsX-like permease family protein n=1 Tax=Embleya sp. AB8 TaxID=3156304 RepID=UPI003C731C02
MHRETGGGAVLKHNLRTFLAHRLRLLTSVLAVALPIAFVAATLILTDTLGAADAAGARATAADVTVSPVAGGDDGAAVRVPTLPLALVDRVRRVAGVGAAYPTVSVRDAVVVDRAGHRLGDRFTVAGLPPTAAAGLVAGRVPVGGGEVVLDRAAAAAARVRVGDAVRVAASPGTFSAIVVGLVAPPADVPGLVFVYLDPASAAARLLGAPDVITAVSVDAAPGVDAEVLRDRVAGALADVRSIEVGTRAEQDSDADGTVATLRAMLLGFAGIALLVGVFLIVNTFAMLTARRTRELGLLRALGAGRGQVKRGVLVEAALLGLVGSTVGLVFGYGVAFGLGRCFDFGAIAGSLGGRSLGGDALVVAPTTPVVAYLVGVPVTIAAAYPPARTAGRVPPMAALREAPREPARTSRRRTLLGVALLVPVALGAVAGGMQALIPALACSLAACVVLGPILVRRLLPVLTSALPAGAGAMGRLAARNAARDPRRTASTAAALMIGVAVVCAMSVTGASMVASQSALADRMLGADLVIAGAGKDLAGNAGDASFTDEVAAAVRAVPGVAAVANERQSGVRVLLGTGSAGNAGHGGSRGGGGDTGGAGGTGGPGSPGGPGDGWEPAATLYGEDPDFPTMLKARYTSGNAADALAHGKVVVGDDYAARHHLRVGDTVRLRAEGGPELPLTVGAIQVVEPPGGSIGRVRGAPMVGNATLDRLDPKARATTVFATVAPGADRAGVTRAVRAALADHPQLTCLDRSGYRAAARERVEALLRAVYAMTALAILLAGLGVLNTLALSLLERTREIGLLRAVGASRVQIARLIRLESLAIAAYGTLLGLVLGLGWGITNQRTTPATTILAIPWPTIAAVSIGATAIGVAAAIMPARRAARMHVLTALGDT